MEIEGGCHCGNVAYRLTWEPEPGAIPARACDCSFCVKHGGVWTSNPGARLVVAVRDRSAVSEYLFGTRTATFHVCARCGVPPLVTSEIEGRTYAVVNVNTFSNVPASMLQRAPASFEGEDASSRLARRQRNWIREVEFVSR